MNITIFETETGKITRSVFTNIDPMLQVNDGESYIEGDFSSLSFYIENNAPVAKLQKPSQHHEFDYSTKTWIDPRTNETEWQMIKTQRKMMLEKTDWTQLPDVPLATKEVWATYRQALRDITNQPDPFTIVWPQRPE